MKWGCIQPLTGGMYIGALQATGCNAQWIISYSGQNDLKTNKNGEITSAGNEYNLLNWLKKNDKMVPYYHFGHQMFQQVDINTPEIKAVDGVEEGSLPDYTDMDLVIAVPVCAGLSNVTIAKDDTKDERNCNMIWIANYTLNIIKPKVYIFENAPALVSEKGASVRAQLESLASKAGYSVAYYKTDTKLHHNCQKRPRTFCCFFKHTVAVPSQLPPELGFEEAPINSREYLDMIPADATQQVPFEMSILNKILLEYTKKTAGENWRNTISTSLFRPVEDNNLFEQFCDFVDSTDYPEKEKIKITTWVRHAAFKKSQGLNFYSCVLCLYGDTTPSVQFKSIQTMMHHKEDRLITVREALHLMGLPHDFELVGDLDLNGPKIGQNVPVTTAKWICSEAVRIINNWENENRPEGKNTMLFDNTHQVIKEI